MFFGSGIQSLCDVGEAETNLHIHDSTHTVLNELNRHELHSSFYEKYYDIIIIDIIWKIFLQKKIKK